jgi:hypothetical protein
MRLKNPCASYEFDREEVGEEEQTAERKWFEMVPYNELPIPIAPRPRGRGIRVNFYVESQFPDMALEIKEAGTPRFKNANDVHRAAHYIGMYMLREMYVKGRTKDDLLDLFQECRQLSREGAAKELIRFEFLRFFDQFNEDLMSEAQMDEVIEKILGKIGNPALKAWAKEDMRRILDDPELYDRSIERTRKRRYRLKSKALQVATENGNMGDEHW